MYGRWHCPCPATALAANASGGVHFALDVARLSAETQAEIGLRTLKLARGGAPANREAKRMVAEKGIAFADASARFWRVDEQDRSPRALPREQEPSAAQRSEARRIAANIAKLPVLLGHA